MGFDAEKIAEEYVMTFDYHTHTTYSRGFMKPHGKGSVEDNVIAGIGRGLKEIAISDHGPGHLFYGSKRDRIDDLRWDIITSQKRHPEIKIYMSVEANIVESGSGIDVDFEEAEKFDFLIAGYHYGVKHGHMIANYTNARKKAQGGGNNGLFDATGYPLDTNKKNERLRELNTLMYIKALRQNDIKILTHPGDKAPVDMAEIAKVCAERGTWMEINTWHMHLTVEEIRLCMKEDVKFVISSDAHTPDRVGTFGPGLVRALEAGLDPGRIVNISRK